MWSEIDFFNLQKKKLLHTIGFGVNFIPIHNNDHVSSLYFCKGQLPT